MFTDASASARLRLDRHPTLAAVALRVQACSGIELSLSP
jgi:hypothetical protein